MKEFKDRVAVVTGAASGIGRAIAARCAREGMKLVLADIQAAELASAEAELKSAGASVVSVLTDVSRREDVEALAQKTVEAFGAVHLLFNNAGVGAGGSVWESTWNDWEWVMGVNLGGVIHGVKIFTPLMISQDADCHIVNTASAAGLLTYHPLAPYQVSKSAIVALSEHLYLSLAQRRTRVGVSVLCPGEVKTRILDSQRNRPANLENAPHEQSRWWAGHVKMMTPCIEAGMSPEEVADQVFCAIREDRFYIFTHPEIMGAVQDRCENLLGQKNPRRC